MTTKIIGRDEQAKSMANAFDGTLTSEEKAAPTYLDWSDATIARAVRVLAGFIKDEMGNSAMMMIAAATVIHGELAAHNHTGAVIDLGEKSLCVYIASPDECKAFLRETEGGAR